MYNSVTWMVTSIAAAAATGFGVYLCVLKASSIDS